jgi:heme-degrading monooxygenase HmoA
VIFSSKRRDFDAGYASVADRMVALAQAQPGFLGVESARDSSGFGITVSYWSSLDAVRAWKSNLEHLAAQDAGRERWYAHYEVRVAHVARAYAFDAEALA